MLFQLRFRVTSGVAPKKAPALTYAMAKFTPSIAGDIRGSIGGTTFSRNRFGNYTRRRTVPVNPDTANQALYRAFFGTLSSTWRAGLAAGLKAAWSTLASTITLYDSMGNPYTPTGQNLFISNNMTRFALGESSVTTPPAVGSFPSTSALTVVAECSATPASRALDATITGSGGATQAWLWYATAPLPRGVTFVGRSKYRLMGFTAGNVLTLNMLAAWEAQFGPLSEETVGRNIHVRVVGCSVGRFTNVPVNAFAEIALAV